MHCYIREDEHSVTDVAWGLAVCATSLVVILFWILKVYYSYKAASPISVSEGLLPEVVSAQGSLTLPDIRAQVQAYLVGICCFFGAAFTTFMAPRPKWTRVADQINKLGHLARRSRFLFVCSLILLVVLERGKLYDPLFDKIDNRALFLALLILFVIPNIIVQPKLKHLAKVTSIAFATVLILFEMTFGLVTSPDLSAKSYSIFTMVQFHFTAVMGAGGQLGHGLRLWDDVVPFYGILPSALIGAWIKFVSDISWQTYYRIVQYMSLAMLLGVPAGIWIWRRNRQTTSLILPTLFVLPHLYSSNPSLWFPNLTGWRTIGLTLAVLTIILVRNSSHRITAVVLGVVSATEILYSFEIGVVVFGASLLVIIMRIPREQPIAALLQSLLFIASMAIFLVVLAIIYYLTFGHSLLPNELTDVSEMYRVLRSPWFSFELQRVDAIAVVIWFHACVIIYASLVQRRTSPIDGDRSVEVFVAAAIVLWFSYYLKRPQTGGLWSIEYLYAFLLPSLFSSRFAISMSQPRRLSATLPALMQVITLSLIIQNCSGMLYKLNQSNNGYGTSQISGVLAKNVVVDVLDRQAKAILELQKQGPVMYASNNSFTMPIETGVYPIVPARSFFWSSASYFYYDRLLKAIEEQKPKFILLDVAAPDDDPPYPGLPPLKAFYDRVRLSLPMYDISDMDRSHWMVLTRK